MLATKTIAFIHPPGKPLEAKVRVPGSKSFTNRALVVAALADGISTLHGVSDSNDSEVLVRLLRKLGIEITESGNSLQVKGNGGKFEAFNGALNVEDAGTVMRFLSALCSVVPGKITLEGSERMHQRPVKELADALTQLGTDIIYTGKSGFPPLQITGGTLKGGKVKVNGSVSSQFISALLMVAPALPIDTEIEIEGEQVSEPYIGMTISVMRHFGVEVSKTGKGYAVKGNQLYKATNYTIEGDASSSSYMLALAAIAGGSVCVSNVYAGSLQSDVRFAYILEKMGCTLSRGNGIKITGTANLKAVEVNMQDMPDTAQTLAVVAAFAEGETVITGLKTLQLKETKRITALQTELAKMGIECRAGDDYIKVKGGNPVGALVNTYNDHRMAMAFAVAGARIEGMSVESPEVVKKSFPAFWAVLRSMGINVEVK